MPERHRVQIGAISKKTGYVTCTQVPMLNWYGNN